MKEPRSGTHPGLPQPWISASRRQTARKKHRTIHLDAHEPTAFPLRNSTDARTAGEQLPRKRSTRTENEPAAASRHPESRDPSLTGLSPARKRTPAKRRQGRRDLFHGCAAAAASPTPPGNPTLDNLGPKLQPNLHRPAENRRSPSHPRPRGPPEATGINGLAGGSTGNSPSPRSTVADGRRRKGKKRVVRRLVLDACSVENKEHRKGSYC